MFNKFKQKIADGVEGVSAGRQTPLRSPGASSSLQPTPRKEQSLNRSSELLDTSSDSGLSHPLDDKYITASSHTTDSNNVQDERSRALSSYGDMPLPLSRSSSRQRRNSNSSTCSNRSLHDSDIESTSGTRIDNLSFNELRELYGRQDKSMRKYKQKFSEIVDAYKILQKEKEKLEGTLTSGQDKQLRKNRELRETIELEQESKRHLEETLRMEMGEKDDQIDVLKTQVALLKSKHGLGSPLRDSGQETGGGEMIQSLQDKVQLLTAEIETLTTDNEHAHASVSRAEQEKKVAIEEVMSNMHELLNEQEQLRAQVKNLGEQVKEKDVTIMNIRAEEEKNERRLRVELMEEMQETVVASALKQQESELNVIFQEKESQMKKLFGEKVEELHRMMEEKDQTKQMSLEQKQSDMISKDDEILELKKQVKSLEDKELELKTKMEIVSKDKATCEQKLSKSQRQLEEEKEKCSKLIVRHEKELEEKQQQHQDAMAKAKNKSLGKVNEVQEQVRKKSQEVNELTKKHETEIEAKIKETSQALQSEHAKLSRKQEAKANEMKKMIKELRQKLVEKEGECSELESSLQDAKTEADQTKSANSCLAESEQKVWQLNDSMEVMAGQVAEWSRKYELLETTYTELTGENKILEGQISEKELCIKELVQKLNGLNTVEEQHKQLRGELEAEKEKSIQLITERDTMQVELQTMRSAAKEDESALQGELNNLKTKLSFVEDELQELTQQLTNKVGEIELLVETLEKQNKQLAMKESELNEKCKTHEELNEKVAMLVEEKQKLEENHSKVVSDLEISKSDLECKLSEDYELKLQQKDEEVKLELNKLLNDKTSSVEDLTRKMEEMHKQEISDIRTVCDEKIESIRNEFQSQIDENAQKHNEYVELTNEEKRKLNENAEDLSRTINDLRVEIKTTKEAKLAELKELSSKHDEDRNNLLAQIDEKNLHAKEVKLLIEQKDLELRSLSEKIEVDKKQQAEDMQTKLDDQEKVWKDKHQLFEKKFKKILSDRDHKNKTQVTELEGKHEEEMTTLQSTLSSKDLEMKDQEELICSLKEKIDEGNSRLKEVNERYENEISCLKSREQDAWNQVEQSQGQLTEMKTDYENRIADFQSKALEDKNKIETLNMTIMSCESSSKDIDAKVSELLSEKNELEQKVVSNERMHEEKMRELVNENNSFKSSYEETIRNLHDDAAEKNKLFEEEKCELLTKQSENQEASSGKLSELKKKAEMKISKIKKEHNEKITVLETVKKELEDKLNDAENCKQELEEKLNKTESDKTDLDEKFNEIETSKNDLEGKLKQMTSAISELEKKLNDAESRRSELNQKLTEIESDRSELEQKLNESDASKTLLEDKFAQAESSKSKLEDKVAALQLQLDEGKQAIADQTSSAREYEQHLMSTQEEHEKAINSVTEKLNAELVSLKDQVSKQDNEILTLKDEVMLKTEKVKSLQDALDNSTVDKMESLKQQKEMLDDEHATEFNKFKVDSKKELDDLEKKLTAKLEEKEFEHNSEVKGMLKQVQMQMGQKDMEIQQAIQEASEVAQRDERQIIGEYDQQIVELQKELRLREKDMLALQSDTQEQLGILHAEREEVDLAHADEVNRLKMEYDQRLEDQTKQHEEQLEEINANKIASIEEEKTKIGEEMKVVEEKYIQKIQLMEDHHRCDMLAQERKYKTQIKQSKNDMRKLLASQGVSIQNLNIEQDSAIMSDSESDQAEYVAYRPEPATGAPPTTPKINVNDRPATLQLTSSHAEAVQSPPKSPQPLEFEYLRNILFNFMMGKQRKQMAKVLTAICHFSPSQVQQVLATVEGEEPVDKKKNSSWF